MIKAFKNIVEQVAKPQWCSQKDILTAISDVDDALHNDLKSIKKYDCIFETGTQNDLVDLLRMWHIADNSPSLSALCITACDEFGVNSPDLRQTVMMAGILGDVTNDNPYHNNLHFKKVLLQSIRMIAVHNAIYEGTEKTLNEYDITTLIIAACIHDLGHDGRGNTLKGVYEESRLERQSFSYAESYLRACGMDKSQLNALKVMLLTTDVTPLGDLTNSKNQMCAAYRFHFTGDRRLHPSLNLSTELKPMEKDAKLTLLACMLHEADIATSAGINYTVTQFETSLYHNEIGVRSSKPSHIIDFLDDVCQRTFLTAAGRKLFGTNLERIITLAEQNVNNGNEVFPALEHTNFYLGYSGDRPEKNVAIN